MGGLERLRNLCGNRDRVGNWHRAACKALRKILAVYQLHDERATAAAVLDTVDLRDVRVIERGERMCFTLEARDPVRIGGKAIGQELQRDVATERGVPSSIDLAHAPRPMRPMISYAPTRVPAATVTVSVFLSYCWLPAPI